MNSKLSAQGLIAVEAQIAGTVRSPHGIYSPGTLATLAFTEVVTLVARSGISPGMIEPGSSVLTPGECTRLLYRIVAINAGNRPSTTAGALAPGS
jgi:hypothetical protein